jgi:hypothetical protein
VCAGAQAAAKGSSLMQPLRPRAAAPSLAQLGSAAFSALERADVAPDAQFFQKYKARSPSIVSVLHACAVLPAPHCGPDRHV